MDGHGIPVQKPEPPPFIIGYLARICPEKGLHILVDAFRRVAEAFGADNVQLHVAGYLGKKDEPYLEELVNQIHEWDLSDSFLHHGEVTRTQKIDFLNRLHVFSVPYRLPRVQRIVHHRVACQRRAGCPTPARYVSRDDWWQPRAEFSLSRNLLKQSRRVSPNSLTMPNGVSPLGKLGKSTCIRSLTMQS